jgi:DNA polymerase III subunit epsilon
VSESTTSSAPSLTATPPKLSRSIWLLDTETTGLSTTQERIVEVAILAYSPTRRAAQSWLINPGRSVPRAARAVHGIDDEMLRDELPFKDVWPLILKTIENGCGDDAGVRGPPLVVAHNAKFDRAFIEAEVERAGFDAPNWDWACSIREVARAAWPNRAGGHGLAALVAALGVTGFEHHRASADVEALGTVLEAAGKILLEKKEDGSQERPRSESRGRVTSLSVLTAALEKSAASMRGSSRAAPKMRTRGSDAAVELAAAEGASEAAAEELYYCVQGGMVWHKTLNCGHLIRSKEVDALSAIPGDRRPCKSCAVPTEPDACSICTDELVGSSEHSMTGGEQVASSKPSNSSGNTTTLACSHMFHPNCIALWRARSTSCPECRADISGDVSDPDAVAAVTSAVGHRQASRSIPSRGGSSAFYGTAAGACYHTTRSCEGLRNARSTVQVSASGRRPCGFCRDDVASSSPVTPTAVQRLGNSSSTDLGTCPSLSDASSGLYFGTDFGHCYHVTDTCDGLRNARVVLQVSASGRRACGVCVIESGPTAQCRLDFRPSLPAIGGNSFVASSPVESARRHLSVAASQVFICPTGTVWHATDQCRVLRSAAVVERVASIPGNRRPCRVCTH